MRRRAFWFHCVGSPVTLLSTRVEVAFLIRHSYCGNPSCSTSCLQFSTSGHCTVSNFPRPLEFCVFPDGGGVFPNARHHYAMSLMRTSPYLVFALSGLLPLIGKHDFVSFDDVHDFYFLRSFLFKCEFAVLDFLCFHLLQFFTVVF